MLPKLVIGPIGPQGAGKDYLTMAIQQHCGADQVGVFSTGDIPREIAKSRGLEPTRPVCNAIVVELVEKHGGDVLARRLEQAILESLQRRDDPRHVLVYNCPRRCEDRDALNRLREHCRVITVFLDRSQKDRFEALRGRGREGEAALTWEQFLVNEGLDQERDIQALGGEADSVLKCYGAIPQLNAQKATWCQVTLPEYAASSQVLTSCVM